MALIWSWDLTQYSEVVVVAWLLSEELSRPETAIKEHMHTWIALQTSISSSLLIYRDLGSCFLAKSTPLLMALAAFKPGAALDFTRLLPRWRLLLLAPAASLLAFSPALLARSACARLLDSSLCRRRISDAGVANLAGLLVLLLCNRWACHRDHMLQWERDHGDLRSRYQTRDKEQVRTSWRNPIRSRFRIRLSMSC